MKIQITINGKHLATGEVRGKGYLVAHVIRDDKMGSGSPAQSAGRGLFQVLEAKAGNQPGVTDRVARFDFPLKRVDPFAKSPVTGRAVECFRI